MPVCEQKTALIGHVQTVISEMVHLMQRSRELVDTIGTSAENTLMELDRQIEMKFGEKERAMGALQHHQREHGC